MSLKNSIFKLASLLIFLCLPTVVHAQNLCPNPGVGTRLGTLFGLGTLGDSSSACDQFGPTFINTISQIIGLMTAVGALWFIFSLFTGALAWLTSGSDKQALDNAKKRITNSVIGLLLVVIAYGLIGAIGYFIGIDILNLESLITALKPA